MDEIFDIIKKTKINRRYLIAALITSELLGIIVFLWVLRTPLYQKFLQTPPKVYSISQMQPQTRYLIAQADYLNGLTTPSGRIAILISSAGQVEAVGKIRADTSGAWYYQIPDELKAGIKTLTAAELDETNNILSLKSYKFRVAPNDIFNFNNDHPGNANENLNLSLQEILPLIDVEEKTTEIPDFESPITPPPVEE